MKKLLIAASLFLMTAGVPAAPQKPAPTNGSAAGRSRTEKGNEPASRDRNQPDDKFIVGLEDVLSVHVWKEPELSAQEVVVRPDGKITLPLVGDIQASGMTTGQLRDRITDRLKEYVAAPTVTVTVLKVMSKKVSIMGMVAKPGEYPLGAPMTVLELLARAGGLQEYADEGGIKIIRTKGGKTEQFKFNYKDIKKGKHLEENIELENGDIVIVP